MRFLFLAVTAVGALFLAQPAGVWGQEVRGQVVDSVAGTPLAGGLVVLLNADGEAVADTRTDHLGRFLLPASERGAYRLRAAHEGYATSTFPEFELQPERALSYILLLPSVAVAETPADPFGGRLAGVCGTNNPGSPTIAGWIRDAQSGQPAREASVVVSWANLPDVLVDRVSISYYSGAVLADSSGFYVICDVPLNTTVAMHAMNVDGVSDFHDLAFGDRVVLVGGEAHYSSDWVWRQDLEIAPLASYETVLSGVVTDGTTGKPVVGAEVELTGTFFGTETDSTGKFRIEHLPSGPANVLVRQLGHQPLRRVINLPKIGTLELPPGDLVLGRAAHMLDPLVVETTAALSPLSEFTRRREQGTGAFITREEWQRQGNPTSTVDVLRRLRGVRIEPGGNLERRWVISMRRAGSRTFGVAAGGARDPDAETFGLDELNNSECPPLIFLDRHYLGNGNTVNLNTEIPLGDVLAVEAHGSTASVPIEFNRRGAMCGVIAFWTRHAAPKTVAVSESGSLFKSSLFHLLVAVAGVTAIFFGLGEGINF